MYAIIETGGKQYRVEEGTVIDVELLDVEKEGKVEFKNILFFNTGSKSKVGAPHINGCTVIGELIQEVSGPKVINFKYKERKNSRRKVGHRQRYSRVKIIEIKG